MSVGPPAPHPFTMSKICCLWSFFFNRNNQIILCAFFLNNPVYFQGKQIYLGNCIYSTLYRLGQPLFWANVFILGRNEFSWVYHAIWLLKTCLPCISETPLKPL